MLFFLPGDCFRCWFPTKKDVLSGPQVQIHTRLLSVVVTTMCLGWPKSKERLEGFFRAEATGGTGDPTPDCRRMERWLHFCGFRHFLLLDGCQELFDQMLIFPEGIHGVTGVCDGACVCVCVCMGLVKCKGRFYCMLYVWSIINPPAEEHMDPENHWLVLVIENSRYRGPFSWPVLP